MAAQCVCTLTLTWTGSGAQDWGAFIGEHIYLQFKDSDRFYCRKLVLLDVADNSDKKEVEQNGHKYFYQFHCAASFLMPSWIGTWYLRRFWTNYARMPFAQFPLFELEKKHNRSYLHSSAA